MNIKHMKIVVISTMFLVVILLIIGLSVFIEGKRQEEVQQDILKDMKRDEIHDMIKTNSGEIEEDNLKNYLAYTLGIIHDKGIKEKEKLYELLDEYQYGLEENREIVLQKVIKLL